MFHIGILCYSVLFRTQSSFGQFAFRAPVERNGAFLNCGVAAQNKTTIPSAASLATLRNVLLSRVATATCVQKITVERCDFMRKKYDIIYG